MKIKVFLEFFSIADLVEPFKKEFLCWLLGCDIGHTMLDSMPEDCGQWYCKRCERADGYGEHDKFHKGIKASVQYRLWKNSRGGENDK